VTPAHVNPKAEFKDTTALAPQNQLLCGFFGGHR